MRGAALTPTLLRTGRLVRYLLRIGLPMGTLRILETTGRSNGLPRATPVALTSHQGELWLVSPFGESDWVRNARAHPQAHLVHRRLRHAVDLIEVDDNTAAPVMRAFRRTYRLVPFVPPAFAATSNSDLGSFLAEAHRHPVFRVASIRAPQ